MYVKSSYRQQQKRLEFWLLYSPTEEFTTNPTNTQAYQKSLWIFFESNNSKKDFNEA